MQRQYTGKIALPRAGGRLREQNCWNWGLIAMAVFSSRRWAGLRALSGLSWIIILLVAQFANARPAVAAEQEPLLEVYPRPGEMQAYDLPRLDALPQVSFRTTTIWTEGRILFSGPSLKRLLADAGVSKGTIRLSALNDYVIDMTVEELDDSWPIIATRMDGMTFGVRENGPLWLIYPFDQNAQFTNDQIYAKSVWQLLSIRVTGP